MEFIFESLLAKFPEVGSEAYGWDPNNLMPDSHEKIAWKCKNNHIWVEKIFNRTRLNTACPKCANL